MRSYFRIILIWLTFIACFLCLLIYLVFRYQNLRTQAQDVYVELDSLSAFTNKTSYIIGDSIDLFLNSSSSLDGHLVRYDGGFNSIPDSRFSIKGARNQDNRYSTWYGHNWILSSRIFTDSLRPGFYFLVLRDQNENQYNIPILINADKSSENKITVVSPTNTWQAYNAYACHSNYMDGITPRLWKILIKFLSNISTDLGPYTDLPLKRPYKYPINFGPLSDEGDFLKDKVLADLNFHLFMKNMDYDIIGDREFEKGNINPKCELLIFYNHSEYWSYEAMGILNQFIKNGGNVLFLSGNNMYRRVEQMEGERLRVMDQETNRELVEKLIGSFYSESGYHCPSSDYRVVDPDHWIFDNIDTRDGDIFDFGTNEASGFETDKLGPFSEGFSLVAIGNNEQGPAHFIIKEYEAGNFLINTSSIGICQSLVKDSLLDQIVSNIIRKGAYSSKVNYVQ